jgi:rubrerythrin
MKSSTVWVAHFEKNLEKKRINWQQKPEITQDELQRIRYGLRAWQKGETSDGHNLRTAAFRYARKINDPMYYKAIGLFIKEEQKHGANLGRYIDLIGEKRIQFDWGDYLFRRIRGLNRSMEVWTVTVIVVELAAQVFYRALKNATNCPLLRQICSDILIDEAYHIRFQQERLMEILSRKTFLSRHLSQISYYLFGLFVARIIWQAHSQAFLAGAVNRSVFLKRMTRKLCSVFALQEYPFTVNSTLSAMG